MLVHGQVAVRHILGDADSQTYFRRDLLEYLSVYKSQSVTQWSDIIKAHDFSKIKYVHCILIVFHRAIG